MLRVSIHHGTAIAKIGRPAVSSDFFRQSPPRTAWKQVMNWQRLLLPLFLLACSGHAAGQLAYTQATPAAQTHGGYAVAADALNPAPGYDREAVGASLSATIQKVGPAVPPTVTHRFFVQLLDAQDQTVPLDHGAGNPVAGAAVTTFGECDAGRRFAASR